MFDVAASILCKHALDSDMSGCLHILHQPSLLSGPERFALGGGALDLFCIISELCVAALQHCSVHACGVYICRWSSDSSMEPAALLACKNPPLLPLLY
jgi:hypothetical protein